MNDLVKEIDTKYHMRSRYPIDLDGGGNAKCLNKNLIIVHRNLILAHLNLNHFVG